MKINLLLGIAAGIGVALFLNSKKGQNMIDGICDNACDWMNQAKDAIENGKAKAQQFADDAKHSAQNII